MRRIRVYEKNQLMSLIDSITNNIITVNIIDEKYSMSNFMDKLTLCQEMAITVGEFIEERIDNHEIVIHLLEQVCNDIYELSLNRHSEVCVKRILEALKVITNWIKNCATEKAVIYFLPYKASMWDSFESIYYETIIDSKCDVYVMPIPYCEKENNNRTYKWEYELFDKAIRKIDYHYVELGDIKPDVIYIHNPYDDTNKVTEVDEKYFSDKLKLYTDMLVYVPYYISGMYKTEERVIEKLFLPGVKNADIVICQSQIQKDIYKKYGMDSDKYLVCGNPKFDVLINYGKEHTVDEIRKKYGFNDNKIILVNTSISYFLNKKNWIKVYGAFFNEYRNSNINILWRPHPLLEASIKSLRPEMWEDYVMLMNQINESNNIIIDKNSWPIEAMFVSDGMISDYSSLLYQFYVTGKPLYSVDGVAKYRDEGIMIFDYYDAYLRSEKVTMSDFVNLIIDDNDVKKIDRKKIIDKYFYLAEGRVGKNIHHLIVNKMLLGM